MPAGLHIVTRRKPGKPVRHYVYAWRGGPQLLVKEGGAKPAVTAELTDAAAALRKARPARAVMTVADLIDRYTSADCAEWKLLARTTRDNYATWHRRIAEKFGALPLELFLDPRMRGDVLDWRDQWSDRPRSADAAIVAFSALLTWAVKRGRISANILLDTDKLYEVDRSDLVWEAEHFARFAPHASAEVLEAVDLAAATGLRRGDLVRLRWADIGEHAVLIKTGKSKGRKLVTVPLIPEAKAVLQRIRARHAAAMAAQRPHRRKPLPETVLSNSYWAAWTPNGLGSRFNDAKQASGIALNFHDLRGTFATRLMLAGCTDQEISDMLGWQARDVARIRAKYVSQARVVVELGKRIAAASARKSA